MQLRVFTNLSPLGQLFNLAVAENGEKKFELTAGATEWITKVAIEGFTQRPKWDHDARDIDVQAGSH